MPLVPSLDGGPPLSAPLRFFVTAAMFGTSAGLLLAWAGADLLQSRWTPAALAFTHFITVGFMMQVLLGALQQLLPVLAGAPLRHPLRVATVVHTGTTLGGVCLVGAFLSGYPILFGIATACMAVGVLFFVATAVPALRRVHPPNVVARALQFGLLGLTVTVSIGLANALTLGWPTGLPLEQLANVHLGWGFVAWGCAVLAAVNAVAMPMFQHAPILPRWFVRSFGAVAVTVVASWTLCELLDLELLASGLSIGVVLVAASFATLTLYLQLRPRRATLDAVQRLWRLGMACALVACALWVASRWLPAVAAWSRWPLLFGALLLVGGLMSVVLGMVYKIVPFLVWMHLQSLGRGRLPVPALKSVVPEFHLNGQARAHVVCVALVLAAAVWPAEFARLAGMALMLSCAWLLRNLLAAMALYRAHTARLAALAP
ncbi:MAG: hypothetical protein U1E84_02595 [Rhodoferax sp.]